MSYTYNNDRIKEMIELLKILLAFTLIALGLLVQSKYDAEFVGGGVILLFVDGIPFIVQNRRRIWLILKMQFIALKGERQSFIRFSMSYQYIIKVKDKYLLLKNSNWDWYQHVGGKYKRIEETQKILSDLNATDDIKMSTCELKKGDLVVFIPAKNGLKFLNWFDSRREREVSHWREFYEELLGGKADHILSKENFPYVNYRFVKSVQTPLKRAPIESGWGCWELLNYDVLELIPNAEQEEELEKLLQKGDTDYIKWADQALINDLGFDKREKKHLYNIGAHTKWVLNKKWTKE